MVRSWRLHRRSRHTLSDLAQDINAAVRGWINHYGAFYRSRLAKVLNAINVYLVRWAMHRPGGSSRFTIASAKDSRTASAVEPARSRAARAVRQHSCSLCSHDSADRFSFTAILA